MDAGHSLFSIQKDKATKENFEKQKGINQSQDAKTYIFVNSHFPSIPNHGCLFFSLLS